MSAKSVTLAPWKRRCLLGRFEGLKASDSRGESRENNVSIVKLLLAGNFGFPYINFDYRV